MPRARCQDGMCLDTMHGRSIAATEAACCGQSWWGDTPSPLCDRGETMTKIIMLLSLLALPAGAVAKDRNRVVLDFATMYASTRHSSARTIRSAASSATSCHGGSHVVSTAASRTAGI